MNSPNGILVNDVSRLLPEFLREMNAEATSIRPYNGVNYPTRLREYANHVVEGDYNWERAWTVRLATLFRHKGINASTFSSYASGEFGDLDLTFPDGTSLWIEIKGAWRYNLHPKVCSYSNYASSLTSRSKGAAKDFIKLCRTGSTHVGMLVIGFDVPSHNFCIHDSVICKMKEHGRFDDFVWSSIYDEFEDSVLPGSRARIWYWQREHLKS